MDARLDSSTWLEIRDAIEADTERLRARELSKEEEAAVAERLLSCAMHPKWEVKAAAARALEFVRDEQLFQRAIALLEHDDHAGVRRDAERAKQRRMEPARSDFLKEEHAQLVSKMLDELESVHGPRAREAAWRVSERIVRLQIREAHHQLVMPLNALSNELVFLLREKLDVGTRITRELKSAIEEAQEDAAYLIKTMKALREYATDVELRYEPVSLHDAVRKAIRKMPPADRNKYAKVRIVNAIPRYLQIDASHERLVTAFSNLLVNACEAFDGVKRHARVRVEARDLADDVIVTVYDNGCGVPQENRESVFKALVTTKRDKGGTGLGLTVAKRAVVDEHGGKIWIESIWGDSTTVYMRLPRKQERR